MSAEHPRLCHRYFDRHSGDEDFPAGAGRRAGDPDFAGAGEHEFGFLKRLPGVGEVRHPDPGAGHGAVVDDECVCGGDAGAGDVDAHHRPQEPFGRAEGALRFGAVAVDRERGPGFEDLPVERDELGSAYGFLHPGPQRLGHFLAGQEVDFGVGCEFGFHESLTSFARNQIPMSTNVTPPANNAPRSRFVGMNSFVARPARWPTSMAEPARLVAAEPMFVAASVRFFGLGMNGSRPGAIWPTTPMPTACRESTMFGPPPLTVADVPAGDAVSMPGTRNTWLTCAQ